MNAQYQTITIGRLADEIIDAYETALTAVTGQARWTNAVEVGADWLYQQDEVSYDAETHTLIVNSPSGATYTANGSCQCQAFAAGQPCWHRAAARVLRRAVERVDAQALDIALTAAAPAAAPAARRSGQELIDELFN